MSLYLLLVQGHLGFDSQDEVRRGVSQLPWVLIDVMFQLHTHVVIHMPVTERHKD